MQLTSKSFSDGAPIPGEFAFAVIDPVNHIALSKNRNPQLSWSGVPEGTKSFALICHDADVPNRADDVNKEDREIPESFPRDLFFHWVLLGHPCGGSRDSCRQPQREHYSEGQAWACCSTRDASRSKRLHKMVCRR